MKPIRSAPATNFDAAYYERWYEDMATRSYIADKAVRFVLSYIEHMDASVRTALDLGCGLGFWKKALSRYAKNIRYTGVEFSPYLCQKFGWTCGDVRTYAPGRVFDLVICQGVLQYLPDDDCGVAIENLSRLARRFLYLEVLTAADALEVCASDDTDFEVFVRPAEWYARQLRRHFVNLGGGLYVKPAMRRHYYDLWCTGT
jgi:SAM-dependent methyltransferase